MLCLSDYMSVCLFISKYLLVFVNLFVCVCFCLCLFLSFFLSFPFFNFFSFLFLPIISPPLTAFVFWNDDRRNNSATDTDPFGMEDFPSVGFPSQTCMERFLTKKERPFGTLSKEDRDIRMDDMEK